jgi:hypothetical protein
MTQESSLASRWIAPRATDLASAAAGDYVYRLQFDLTGVGAATAVIEGRWGHDDEGELRLNGLCVPACTDGGFGGWAAFALPSAMLSASGNVVEFRIHNGGGPTGLRVEFTNVVFGCTNPCVSPYLVTQPGDFITNTPGQGTFSVTAGGTGPLSYQWFCNGVLLTNGPNVSGAQSATLTLQNATASALYTVRVTNPCGQATSSGARVIFRPRLQGPVYTPLAFTFQLPTVAGTLYRVERADTLGPDAVWKVLTTVPGTGALVPVTDPEPASATRFYRAVEIPAQP